MLSALFVSCSQYSGPSCSTHEVSPDRIAVEAQKMHVVHVADFHESWLVQVWPNIEVRKKHRECEPENCKL